MSTTADTVIDPRVSGGVYATGGREYRLVYVWPTDDLSIIWAGSDKAIMLEAWHWADSDTVIHSPVLADLRELEADLQNRIDLRDVAVSSRMVADLEAVSVTDQEAGQSVADMEVERSSENDLMTTDTGMVSGTGVTGTGKVVHEIVSKIAGMFVTKCGKTNEVLRKQGAIVTCKGCLKV